MLRTLSLFLTVSLAAAAQQAPSSNSQQNPPVKVNILNVCTPSASDQQELQAALARLPKSPHFASDYEISRGVSTLENGSSAKYVRLRRDMKSDSPLETVQYSLSADPDSTVETLVFRGRDVKDLLALSIEDKLSTSASKPLQVIESDTPASRIRLERAGKTTVGLARCEEVDQSKYNPIFAQASAVLANYRHALGLRTLMHSDIAWMSAAGAAAKQSSAHK
ncbi:MAG TPA: hypothetical protein VFQ00_07330 [Terriglobales bacterium]|nr:hypothetical protein [Terriglobales bacterium]